jgi:uncharacterized protein with GYD domain
MPREAPQDRRIRCGRQAPGRGRASGQERRKIESFYFAFGVADAFVIADVPDHASASAISLAVSASGGAHCKTIDLIAPERGLAEAGHPRERGLLAAPDIARTGR